MRISIKKAKDVIVLGSDDEGVLMNGLIIDPLYFKKGFMAWSSWFNSLSDSEYSEFDFNDEESELINLMISVGIVITKDTLEPILNSEVAFHYPELYQERTLFLLVSQACNQKCIYCFAEHGKFKNHKPSIMTIETALRAVTNIAETIDTNGILHIVFFGGEPLLAWDNIKVLLSSIKVLPEIIEKEISVDFTTTTNITILPEDYISVCNEYNLTMMVNIDGLREHHNLQRPLNTNESSYDLTVAHTAFCMEGGISVPVRTTVTSKNQFDMTNIAKRHKVLEADSIIMVPVIPMTSAGNILDDDYYPDIDIYLKGLIDILEEKIWNIEEISPLWDCYSRILNRRTSATPCGAVTGSFPVVDTDGNKYLCPYLTGDDRYQIGTINDNNETATLERLHALTNVDNRTDCKYCEWRYLCSGYCPLNILMPKGNEPEAAMKYWRQINCELPRKILEWSLLDICRKGYQNYINTDDGKKEFFNRKDVLKC